MTLRPKKSKKKHLSRRDLKRIHEQRSEKAQQVDESLRAAMPPTLEAWAKNPAKYDVSGIDYPEEWRQKDEIERLKMLEQYLPLRRKELQEMKKKGDDTTMLEENIKIFSTNQKLLKWQKRHPFISAGIDADKVGYGKENYEWALKNNIDFGINLRDPENSFLHEFHLKKHDIKGMRVIFERDNKKMPGSRAWYVGHTKLFHLPPESSFLGQKREWTNKTILHEIGHHIQYKSKELNEHWAGMHYTFKFPVKTRDGKGYTSSIKKIELAPYEVIWRYRDYFDSNPIHFFARYNVWHGKYIPTKDLKPPLVEKHTRLKEMWAETFAQYRLGNLSRERGWKKGKLELIDVLIKQHKKLMSDFEGSKNRKEYQKLKRDAKELENARIANSAQQDNLLKFERMMKRWDKRGWKPDYDQEMNLSK